MHLIVGGHYREESQLPIGDLPENAVRFIEPETPEKLAVAAVKYMLLSLLIAGAAIGAAVLLHGGIRFSVNLFGFVLPLLLIVPHELLHAVCFPKDAEVELFWSIKSGMAFVVSTAPVSKTRFILLSLCPNLVLGWLPLLVWMRYPEVLGLSGMLLPTALIMIASGCGDYLNVYHAMTQMPKGSIQQLSGFHSYWYPSSKTK